MRIPPSRAVRTTSSRSPWVPAVEVGDVIAVVALAGQHERHQPHASDPQSGEVIHALAEARQVAAAVAVGIEEGFDVEAVDHRVLPPDVARCLARHAASCGSTCCPNESMKELRS